jgi:hypothetical protein
MDVAARVETAANDRLRPVQALPGDHNLRECLHRGESRPDQPTCVGGGIAQHNANTLGQSRIRRQQVRNRVRIRHARQVRSPVLSRPNAASETAANYEARARSLASLPPAVNDGIPNTASSACATNQGEATRRRASRRWRGVKMAACASVRPSVGFRPYSTRAIWATSPDVSAVSVRR